MKPILLKKQSNFKQSKNGFLSEGLLQKEIENPPRFLRAMRVTL